MLKKTIKEKLNQESISLEAYGVNELAWDKDNAEKMIEAIKNDEIGILGGDVYKLISTDLESLYDNWSCEPRTNETLEEYYRRSKLESLKYIKEYPIEKGENILFSITFTEKVC